MAVSRETATSSLDADLDTLWRAFCLAAGKAQTTLRLEDGIEAGYAWRNWLETFAPLQACQPGIPPKPLPGYAR